MFKKNTALLSLVLLILFIVSGCFNKNDSEIVMITGTTVENSGLLDILTTKFTKDAKIGIKAIASSTGQALKSAQNGNVDVLFVHSKDDEEKFVQDGYGVKRYDVMYNHFIIVGPSNDPAGIKKYDNDISKAMEIINNGNFPFVSRGDQSGTHKFELVLWNELKVLNKHDEYFETGIGMAATLNIADQKKAYTLCDEATFYSLRGTFSLEVIVDKDPKTINQYGVIKVKQKEQDEEREKMVDEFIKWLLSDETQDMINSFGEKEYGKAIFTANTDKKSEND